MAVRSSRASRPLTARDAAVGRGAPPAPDARPFLKWAGGKTQLLPEILRRLPATMDTFYEPFLGGGAVFFALAREGRFRRAVLSDRNAELVELYQVVQGDVEALIVELRRLAKAHSEEQYYEVRARKLRSPVRRAARVLYLNKTGYNGLYRVNRAGEFNVPFGRYERPRILNEEVLRAAARALRGAKILEADFAVACRSATPSDVVYIDPPYLPLSPTSNFSAYDRHPFGIEEHRRLAETFASLAERKVYALLSNSDTPETRRLFGPFGPAYVNVTRPINSKRQGRGAIQEMLVENLARRPRERA